MIQSALKDICEKIKSTKRHVNKTSETYRVCLVKSGSVLREKISKVDEYFEVLAGNACSITLSCIHTPILL